MARNTWGGGLDQRTRLMVEHIAVKYDAAWKSGWTSEDTLWKNPYCEGLIEATAFMADESDERDVRMAIVEYCRTFGYMLMGSQRPDWMNELWERAA